MHEHGIKNVNEAAINLKFVFDEFEKCLRVGYPKLVKVLDCMYLIFFSVISIIEN